ncbi:unnamed protein product [Commensalibacter communis]|uniref:hypothetical protein n=1 Tax=Commensalibacter communis TaxID=2972786 RepID=UPI0022FF9A88|nr:hypothetical protein [Commensalibacter communis]CAI3949997.1 unnamed protein product [Commensalibacter communis]
MELTFNLSEGAHPLSMLAFNMPEVLIEILASNQEQRYFTYHATEEYQITEMKFHSLTTTHVFEWRKKQFIDLLCYINDYEAEGMLVWSVNHNKLANIDFEHEAFKILSVWKEPQKLFKVLNKIWK